MKDKTPDKGFPRTEMKPTIELNADRWAKSRRVVTVCDKCLTESCWKGVLMCEEAATAGTITDTEEYIASLAPSKREQELSSGKG